MEYISFNENNMRIRFRINDDRTVELTDFSAAPDSQDMPRFGETDSREAGRDLTRKLISLQITGHNSLKGYKHNAGSDSAALLYVRHTVQEEPSGKHLRIELEDAAEPGLSVKYHMQFFTGAAAVRTWVELENKGTEEIGIDYVTSFIYEGLGKNGKKPFYEKCRIYVPRNSWANESQWNDFDVTDLGLSRMPICGHNLPDSGNMRFHYGNTGSWSTCEYLPVGIFADTETNEVYYFQVDFSGSWQIEYGSSKDRNLYIALLGPNDEGMWWKKLRPGESFATVPAAFGVTLGAESEAAAELTKYRRAIRRPNPDDEHCYVVFNDYMNCLFGDPTQEKEKQIIDIAAQLGCEYYCMDCGWYAKGFWWDTIGEWRESSERFPNGLKSIYDYARTKGLHMGMWLEIEAMGVESSLAGTLPDDWFVCNHGRRRVEDSRYLLDFRNPAVRQYCTDVIERLIRDYGCEYFKVDYNVTTGPGSDLDTDSRGQALLDHYRALYDWWQSIYDKHPDLIVEACSSGAQRMDYGLLSIHSLQSVSDQTDCINNSYIGANVAAAVTPEQAGMWVYPYEDDTEHIIYNMVSGLLLRPYISGMVWDLPKEKRALLAEGIELYKEIRQDVKSMTPFFPNGFNSRKAASLSYGLRGEKKEYLSVFGVDTDTVDVKIGREDRSIRSVRVLYPAAANCTFCVERESGTSVLKVKLPQKRAARLFEVLYD